MGVKRGVVIDIGSTVESMLSLYLMRSYIVENKILIQFMQLYQVIIFKVILLLVGFISDHKEVGFKI